MVFQVQKLHPAASTAHSVYKKHSFFLASIWQQIHTHSPKLLIEANGSFVGRQYVEIHRTNVLRCVLVRNRFDQIAD